jgi:hypothetical protein
VIPQRKQRPSPVPPSIAAEGEPSLHDAARLHLASDRLPWQRSLRWEPPHRDRRLLLIGLLIAIAFTAIELAGFGLGMRRQIAREAQPPRPQTIEVVLIEPPQPAPVPPEPVPPPFERHPSQVRIEAPKVELSPPPRPAEEDTGAMRARHRGSGAPQLFNPDGSIRLAPPSAAPKPPPNPQEAAKQRWAEIEKRGDNPLDCKRTRFSQAFKPDMSLGDEVSSKYLKWVGLGDPEAIRHRAEQREARAAEGCDPAK